MEQKKQLAQKRTDTMNREIKQEIERKEKTKLLYSIRKSAMTFVLYLMGLRKNLSSAITELFILLLLKPDSQRWSVPSIMLS